jgi:hypothetical protein
MDLNKIINRYINIDKNNVDIVDKVNIYKVLSKEIGFKHQDSFEIYNKLLSYYPMSVFFFENIELDDLYDIINVLLKVKYSYNYFPKLSNAINYIKFKSVKTYLNLTSQVIRTNSYYTFLKFLEDNKNLNTNRLFFSDILINSVRNPDIKILNYVIENEEYLRKTFLENVSINYYQIILGLLKPHISEKEKLKRIKLLSKSERIKSIIEKDLDYFLDSNISNKALYFIIKFNTLKNYKVINNNIFRERFKDKIFVNNLSKLDLSKHNNFLVHDIIFLSYLYHKKIFNYNLKEKENLYKYSILTLGKYLDVLNKNDRIHVFDFYKIYFNRKCDMVINYNAYLSDFYNNMNSMNLSKMLFLTAFVKFHIKDNSINESHITFLKLYLFLKKVLRRKIKYNKFFKKYKNMEIKNKNVEIRNNIVWDNYEGEKVVQISTPIYPELDGKEIEGIFKDDIYFIYFKNNEMYKEFREKFKLTSSLELLTLEQIDIEKEKEKKELEIFMKNNHQDYQIYPIRKYYKKE